MAWWDGLRVEVDVDLITLGDLIKAADLGVLAECMAMIGDDRPVDLTVERLQAVAFLALLAFRQQRPETTIDEVHDMPWSALNNLLAGEE